MFVKKSSRMSMHRNSVRSIQSNRMTQVLWFYQRHESNSATFTGFEKTIVNNPGLAQIGAISKGQK